MENQIAIANRRALEAENRVCVVLLLWSVVMCVDSYNNLILHAVDLEQFYNFVALLNMLFQWS